MSTLLFVARRTLSCIVLLSIIVVSACSGGRSSNPSPIIPQTTAPAQGGTPQSTGRSIQGLGLKSNGGTMKSFSDAVNMVLADADYDKFIDSSIVGVDRKTALTYLKLMPKNMRGDFTYVDYTTGKVLSNRADLISTIKFKSGAVNASQSAANRVMSSTRQAMSYPPNFGSGGSFIRNYSEQGETAMYGYATPPCDISLASSNDSGNMYFNAYSGSSSGSIVDGGLSQGSFPNSSQTVNAFVNIAGSGFLFSGWTNESQTWSCGTHLGMMFGTISTGTAMMLMVGVPSFDPTQFQLPPATATWFRAAWNFFPIPSALQSGASSGSWNGIPTPCTTCYVARMFTIAEPGSPDGSCYGDCNNTPTGRWDQTVGGNLTSNCSQTSQQATCTIEYQSNGNWLGGEWDTNSQTGQGGVIFSEANQQSGLEGLNDNYRGSTASTASIGQFVTPLPVAPAAACTPDSANLCDELMSSSVISQCDTGLLNIHGAPILLSNTRNVFDIFQLQNSLELLEAATETITHGGTNCATLSTSWSPNEPAVNYGDPNLP
jgi:hypothetical protein